MSSRQAASRPSEARGGSAEAREGGEHEGEAREGGEGGEHEGEHGGEAHDEEGEESGVYIANGRIPGTLCAAGRGLVSSFSSEADAFVGTVENTTGEKLCAIRVEVHLDSGTELGPTARVDLPSGQTTNVTLPTEGEAFESFTAHPEMSPCG